jgi:hypothetical protein
MLFLRCLFLSPAASTAAFAACPALGLELRKASFPDLRRTWLTLFISGNYRSVPCIWTYLFQFCVVHRVPSNTVDVGGRCLVVGGVA